MNLDLVEELKILMPKHLYNYSSESCENINLSIQIFCCCSLNLPMSEFFYGYSPEKELTLIFFQTLSIGCLS